MLVYYYQTTKYSRTVRYIKNNCIPANDIFHFNQILGTISYILSWFMLVLNLGSLFLLFPNITDSAK